MAIDNDVYDRVGTTWWDDDNPVTLLHGSMTAGRMRYFRAVLARLGRLPDGGPAPAALDGGSGGGFLAEEFCREGFRVTGVDPSEVSVRTARAHAVAGGLDIDYRTGAGERLPAADAAFDVPTAPTSSSRSRTSTGSSRDGTRPATRRHLPVRHAQPDRGLETGHEGVAGMAAHPGHRLRGARLGHVPAPWGAGAGAPAPRDGQPGHRRARPPRRSAGGAAGIARLRLGRLTYRGLSDRVDMGPVRSTRIFYMGYAVKEA